MIYMIGTSVMKELNCKNIAYKKSSVFSISLKQRDVNSTLETYLGPSKISMMEFFAKTV